MLRVALFFVLFGPLGAGAQTNLAHEFSKLPAGASVVVMPAEIELFEISTGGVTEPRADWTEIAERYVAQGLRSRKAKLGAQVKEFEQGNDAAIGGLAYGREQEREADRIGVELMAKAGYAPIEAARVWSQLLEEAKAEDSIERSVLFATHPPAEEREQLLIEAVARTSGGRVAADTYRQMLAPHRTAFLRDEILRGRYGETLVLLERMPQDGEVLFYKGEAHRMRENFKDAIAAYGAAEGLENAPAELYRSLGLVLLRLGERAQAGKNLARYLELKPNAPDAELVRAYL